MNEQIKIGVFLRHLLKEVYFYVKIRASGKAITDRAHRHLRAGILSQQIDWFHRVSRSVDFQQKILITPTADFALSEGVFLDMKYTNQYLKISGKDSLNQGKQMHDFLKSKGVQVKTVVDVGANWGEVGMYFIKRDPNTRVLAIEASSDNFKILKTNCEGQYFDTKNIILVNEAVCDFSGKVGFSRGQGAENRIVNGHHEGNKESVKCDTLSSLVKRFGFETIDFLKIDIEGEEPLLTKSVREELGKIRSVLIEVGKNTPHDTYLPMLEMLWDNGMDCYEWLTGGQIKTFEEMKKVVMSIDSVDLWFIKK